jgi:hypothetical protein
MIVKIISGLAFIAMVSVNILANALPINNRTTGDISDAYPNLFAPAGITFSIWGVIYLLLAGFVIYQFINRDKEIDNIINLINPLFIVTSIINILWIFSWHYDFIGISVLLMLSLLFFLIRIVDVFPRNNLTFKIKIFTLLPFNVYFGWITVATIANITVFLVSIGWNGFGIANYIWMNIILIVGALIGILRMRKDKSIVYGLVLVWAYSGILLKHISSMGFSGSYPSVIITTSFCIFAFITMITVISRNIQFNQTAK